MAILLLSYTICFIVPGSVIFALAGVAGKTIVDKAGSDDYVIEDEGVEIVDDTDETA